MKTSTIIGQLVAVALIAIFFQSELKAMVGVVAMQGMLYANNYFFLGLFHPAGFTVPSPYVPKLDMGSSNLMQLKFIYLARYLLADQFLLDSYAQGILKDIERRLELQVSPTELDALQNLSVPTVQWDEITAEEFHNRFVLKSVPVILKNVPSAAKELWAPEYFAETYGGHEFEVSHVNNLSTLRMNFTRYVAAHGPQGDPERGEDVWYVRSMSDIFDKYPEMNTQLGHRNFDSYMRSRFITAQIFMGMTSTSGTSYHCANFNNLFFQIRGKKKWTFVSPHYNALMYPMFNAKSMDVASFLTTVALKDPEAMEKTFPLYKYAPKMVATLEPGDVLMNPPWQWHMIENLEPVSVAVATRWFLAPGQQFQNSLHSTLQFLSPYIWGLYYEKMLNLQRGVTAHKASNTPPVDERFNFGKEGSAAAFRPKIFPPRIYPTDSLPVPTGAAQ